MEPTGEDAAKDPGARWIELSVVGLVLAFVCSVISGNAYLSRMNSWCGTWPEIAVYGARAWLLYLGSLSFGLRGYSLATDQTSRSWARVSIMLNGAGLIAVAVFFGEEMKYFPEALLAFF